MSGLRLMRLQLHAAQLMRFARDVHGLRSDDEGSGYAVHSWVTAMFGTYAPKPFRFFDHNGELLGYTRADASDLLAHSQAFAPAHAFAALVADSLATKAMPVLWREGQRLQVDVLACPVTRNNNGEKDVYLRALDRLGDAAPPRAQVYGEWFRRQWSTAVEFDQVVLTGFSRRRLLRRTTPSDGKRKPHSIERPQASFRAIVRVADSAVFAAMLDRGIGRHRAFGFGMVLLRPAP